MLNSEQILVAIDGPSASGKSTVSRRVAEQLGFVYVDSGSLYRGITWKAWTEGVDCKDAAAVIGLVGRIRMEFSVIRDVVCFTIDGTDPGSALRSEPVVERVSDIAAIPEVRDYINDHLRATAAYGHVVMEGRDIGTVVFPDSPFQFYLDADPRERARRRHLELQDGEPGPLARVLDSLKRRDEKDTTRTAAPLQVSENARVVNTTRMSIDEVVQEIVSDVRHAGIGS